jgi:hypothetical protein
MVRSGQLILFISEVVHQELKVAPEIDAILIAKLNQLAEISEKPWSCSAPT